MVLAAKYLRNQFSQSFSKQPLGRGQYEMRPGRTVRFGAAVGVRPIRLGMGLSAPPLTLLACSARAVLAVRAVPTRR